MGYEVGAERPISPGKLPSGPATGIDVQSAITAINRVKATQPRLNLELGHRRVPRNELLFWVRVDADGAPASCFVANLARRDISIGIVEAAAEAGLDVGGLRDVTPTAAPRLIDRPLTLGPAEWRIFVLPHEIRDRPPARKAGPRPDRAGRDAPPSRLVIEHIYPEIDGGRYPVKRIVGDRLEVWADIFGDGHDVWRAALLSRAVGGTVWSSAPMRLHENDRWVGAVTLGENRRYLYGIEAWADAYASWTHGLASKYDAGQDVAPDLIEGRRLVSDAAARATGDARRILAATLAAAGEDAPIADRVNGLLAADVGAAMAEWGARHNVTVAKELEVVVDRPAARFGSWYEMFPRSQGSRPGRSATFRDCIERLDDIRAMGFDVIYLVPIHPIGHTNRKGRNNALTAAPDDPGSPYAIGSEAGGHDAIDPELGTLEDFRALVAACHDRGMEVALDFAVQCSLDHPWIKAHPEWFEFRPDGSITYAENPPKKYQDIVNLNLRGDGPMDLWEALRDIVLFWVGQGVRIFRVDNPHTKPFPFWEWLIRRVQDRHPDVIFLAEA
ncbi:MAG: maltotransferase domain-containing protein, partial [Roseiarcus sp.]